MENLELVFEDAQERMDSAISSLEDILQRIRTGRPQPEILSSIKVDYYGQPTQISQAASISVEARDLVIKPFDKSYADAIAQAIIKANIGLNPNSLGDVIRLTMPPLSEEMRRDLAKQAKQEGENGKNNIRAIRRSGNQDFKQMAKDKEISQDDEHRAQTRMQELTDSFIEKINQLISDKERQLLEV